MSHTEDDTFEALCRIPRHELDQKLDIYASWFEDHRMRYHCIAAENKRIIFRNKFRRLVGIDPNKISNLNTWNIALGDEMHTIMQGTGWTLESYTAEVDKPILKKRKEIRTIKMKRRAYFIIGYLIACSIGILTSVFLGLSITDGITLSISLCNVITLLSLLVIDKMWPWPYSYWWQYE